MQVRNSKGQFMRGNGKPPAMMLQAPCTIGDYYSLEERVSRLEETSLRIPVFTPASLLLLGVAVGAVSMMLFCLFCVAVF